MVTDFEAHCLRRKTPRSRTVRLEHSKQCVLRICVTSRQMRPIMASPLARRLRGRQWRGRRRRGRRGRTRRRGRRDWCRVARGRCGHGGGWGSHRNVRLDDWLIGRHVINGGCVIHRRGSRGCWSSRGRWGGRWLTTSDRHRLRDRKVSPLLFPLSDGEAGLGRQQSAREHCGNRHPQRRTGE
jgi:hypothetical protein